MADIDFELISPSATQADDAVLVRRGASAPNVGALMLTADLLDRATHTGTQLAATISNFDAAVAANSAVTANTAKVTNATHTGDVTGATVLTIANLAVVSGMIADDAVGNDKLANMAVGTIKARIAAGTGNPQNATGTEVTALLDLATVSVKGLAPVLSGVATEYLDGTGAYSTPAGGSGAPDWGAIVVGQQGLVGI